MMTLMMTAVQSSSVSDCRAATVAVDVHFLSFFCFFHLSLSSVDFSLVLLHFVYHTGCTCISLQNTEAKEQGGVSG